MSNKKEICVAVDYGGTKLMIGAVSRNGEIIASSTFKTGFVRHKDAVDFLIDKLDCFIQERSWGDAEICAVGMGLVGQIDNNRGIWEKMYNLKDDAAVNIASGIWEKYGVPCSIDNDVKAALMAERILGYGKKSQNFAYVNIGTGIAAGFICDGRILRGHLNDAGEIGHYMVRIGIGSNGGIGEAIDMESIASGGGMARRFAKLAHEENNIENINVAAQQNLDTKALFEMADQGNALAKRILDDAAEALNDMISNIVSTCAPEAIVFGGGVMRDGRMLSNMLQRIQKKQILNNTHICLTELDPTQIGLLGAAMLGFSGGKE